LLRDDMGSTDRRQAEVKFPSEALLEYESRSAEGQSYRLGRRLKGGSTGDVFETSHPLLPGACAIKILRPELVDQPEALQGFRADLEAVSALRHPNIVHVIEVGSLPGVPPFVVMEMLEGRLLGERLAGHRTLTLEETVEIVKAVAAALQAAHSRGVIHGEVNPGNVFLSRVEGYDRGMVKLLNFGIYRLRRVDAAASLTAETTRYYSPEQAAGRLEEIDGRSDQFALAALAYRMLAGVDSFPGESAISLLYQIVHDSPALERPPEITEEVEAVIRRALSKDKWDRFESVLTFARAFESAAAGVAETPPARPAPTPPPAAAPQPMRVIPIQPGANLGAELRTGGVDPGAMTMRGFAASRPTADRPAAPHPEPPPEPAPRHFPRWSPPPRGEEPPPRVQAPPFRVQEPPRRAQEAPPPRRSATWAEEPTRPAPQHRTAASRPVQPAHPGGRPAAQAARPQAARPSAQPRQGQRLSASNIRVSPRGHERADSLLMEPFFAAYPDGHERADTIDLYEDMERPPRQGWKVFLFLVGVGLASLAASLAVGWKPPLAWRQTTLWRELGLPGAASAFPTTALPAPVDSPPPAAPGVDPLAAPLPVPLGTLPDPTLGGLAPAQPAVPPPPPAPAQPAVGGTAPATPPRPAP
jgi:serine/threonine protein kinase